MSVVQSYIDEQGLAHWPDAPLGSEKYYGIDFDDLLTAENDIWTSITWTVPTGMTKMDEKEVENEMRIKLSADTNGSHKIICELESSEGMDTQKFIQVMFINVI